MIKVAPKILVTCALPYANGSLHLGNMLEHIQADIWVRYQRIRGKQVYFICADDAHGTPIMLKAKQLGMTPEVMINNINQEHQTDLAQFEISYDNYYTTHSDENHELVISIYNRLKANNLIKTRIISQLYDPINEIFLPDRFVTGCCPKCQSPDQYGDNCEICGATYNPTDLIKPKSILSGVTPVLLNSKHLFFDLPALSKVLHTWIRSGALQEQVANKMQEWFDIGLQQWDISRDAPYFGFEVPDAPGKYFYVWLDAPIGYIGAFKNLCNKRHDLIFDEFWHLNSKVDLYHFIGKDITYFHGIFWPAILEGSNLRKPTNLFVHGYVTINGAKMSKSRGTLIKASTYLAHLDASYLRYYYATKLSSDINDIDLNFHDFVNKVNADIINKVINLAARNASFLHQFFNNQLSTSLVDQYLYDQFVTASVSIGEAFNNRETNRAIREIMILADQANYYINQKQPWVVAKQKHYQQDLHNICSMGINLFRLLITYLQPVLPNLAIRVEAFLNTKLHWEAIVTPLTNHKICHFQTLLKRITLSQVKAIIDTVNHN